MMIITYYHIISIITTQDGTETERVLDPQWLMPNEEARHPSVCVSNRPLLAKGAFLF